MPNKRFLGLGFTFTATDKGLEKKLTSVSDLLTDIDKGLTKVNKKFKGFESLLKNADVPKMDSAPSMGRPKQRARVVQEPRRSIQPARESRSVMPELSNRNIAMKSFSFEEDLSNLHQLGEESSKWILNIKNSFADIGGDSKEFLQKLSMEKLSLNNIGELTIDSEQKISDLILKQAKTITLSDSIFSHLKKGIKGMGDALSLIYAATKDYFSEVKDSFGELAGTLGIRLHDIIPPQFMAFGKLLKSVVAGPLKGLVKGAKNIFGRPSKEQKAKQLDLQKQLKGIKMFSNIDKKLGKNTKSESLYQKTSELVDLEKSKQDENKKGVLGKIGDILKKLLFSPFTLLGIAAGLLGKGFSALFSPIKTLGKLWKWAGEGLFDFAKTIFRIGKGFGEVIAEIAVFGAAIYGFVKGILNTKEEWASFFTGIGDLAKSVWGLIKGIWNASDSVVGSFLALHPALDAVVQTLKDFGKFFLDLPMMLLKTIAKGFENISGWLGIGAGMLGKTMTAASKTVDSVTASISAPAPMAQKDVDKVDALRTSTDLNQQNEVAKSSQTQVELMEQQNGIMSQILAALQKSPPGGNAQPVNVRISSDARKQGFALQKQELDAHGLAGQ
jgi:hypothetical protein